MSKLFCILLAALMLGGCVRSEVREARRERAPLREVFPPPTLEQAAPPTATAPEPGTATAAASDEAPAEGDAPSESDQAGVEMRLDSPTFADEFSEARPAVEEAQQAAADTAAADVAAAAAADAALAEAGDDAADDAGGLTDDLITPEPEPGDESALPAPALEEDRAEAAPAEAAPPAPVEATAPAVATEPAEAAGPVVQPLPGPDTRTPPRIVVSTRPAILVPLYGKPRMVKVPGTALTRIENTPGVVLKGKSGNYYIPVYDGFMHSKKLDGNWIVTKPIPKVLHKGKEEALKAGQLDLFAAVPSPRTGRTPTLELGAPRVIVSSQPTALVVVDGPPGFQRVPGTELSRVVNSESVMFRDEAAGQLYVQIGERWYRAPSLGGPWSGVPEGELPADISAVLQAAS